MAYNKLSADSVTANGHNHLFYNRRRVAAAASLLVVATLSLLLLLLRPTTGIHKLPTTASISKACSITHHPSLCLSSLAKYPHSTVTKVDLVHASVDVALNRVNEALSGASAIADLRMTPRLRIAYQDCMELLEDSVEHLSNSLDVVRGPANEDDVRTWLSAAGTSLDTCTEGLEEAEGDGRSYVKDNIAMQLSDLGELVSNSLALFSDAARSDAFAGIPIENRRRRLLESVEADPKFPSWLGNRERRLLQTSAAGLKPDFVVSMDGTGTHTTIEAAVKAAPKRSARRVVIYIKAGRYNEHIKVGRKKTNLMFIGDGKGKTVIAGGRSIYDNLTTFHTATFAATGYGFIARDLAFENWAGPKKHQAVALRVGADHAVVYRCNIIGYQDTLYVHSQRQFYRECDIYGTVDFVFGNAAVVLQRCRLWARRPLAGQKNTITAQGRKDSNQNTGISIQACWVKPTPDLERVKWYFPTYLGRPWKLFSRTVFMESYIGAHVVSPGWLEWNADFALDTLYYAEYMNHGPGAAVGGRVRWPGYRVMTSAQEANNFTVGSFLTGAKWLPSTGISYLSGLSV